MPDFRSSLQVLKETWEDCTKCSLGVRRKEVKGQFVFGEGAARGIMLIGEGPGIDEEASGKPFVGRSGEILKAVIDKLGLTNLCYITNTVACRSCAEAFNSEGQPILKYERLFGEVRHLVRDEPPTPMQIAACLPRLYEEIYLVDPVLIVTLGAEAAKAIISERSFSILNERGKAREIRIPGAWSLPDLTNKKKVWLRKAKGEYVMPTVQNEVRYLMLPTLHPAYVLRRVEDRSFKNPMDTFLQDMREAAAIYDRYMLETYGSTTPERRVDIEEIKEIAYAKE